MNVPHWIYTRTLGVVEMLAITSNLTVNVSADRDNYSKARAAALKHGVRLCYLATSFRDFPTDLPPGSVVFPDYPLRGRSLPVATDAPWWQTLSHDQQKLVCPADFFGQSEAHRCGPCQKCLSPAARL